MELLTDYLKYYSDPFKLLKLLKFEKSWIGHIQGTFYKVNQNK